LANGLGLNSVSINLECVRGRRTVISCQVSGDDNGHMDAVLVLVPEVWTFPPSSWLKNRDSITGPYKSTTGKKWIVAEGGFAVRSGENIATVVCCPILFTQSFVYKMRHFAKGLLVLFLGSDLVARAKHVGHLFLSVIKSPPCGPGARSGPVPSASRSPSPRPPPSGPAQRPPKSRPAPPRPHQGRAFLLGMVRPN